MATVAWMSESDIRGVGSTLSREASRLLDAIEWMRVCFTLREASSLAPP